MSKGESCRGLGTTAHGVIYGGKNAFTGPTLAGCTLSPKTLTIQFNATLLRGDGVGVQLQKYGESVYTPHHPRAPCSGDGFRPLSACCWSQHRPERT